MATPYPYEYDSYCQRKDQIDVMNKRIFLYLQKYQKQLEKLDFWELNNKPEHIFDLCFKLFYKVSLKL